MRQVECGTFSLDEIRTMRKELALHAVVDETTSARENRAVAILERRQQERGCEAGISE